MPLDPKDRDRLEKLLNMLGSPVDGEIANAGRMIQKMATRYNVTPADLCLNNRIGSPKPEHPQQETRRPGAWGESPFARHSSGRSWDDIFRERDQRRYNPFGDDGAGSAGTADAERDREAAERRREAGERIRREQERQDAEKARQRRQDEARAKSARKAKSFPGTYFGLLGRLKAIYESKFDDLDTWKIDFIELVLGDLKADRQMTIRQREMAKAVIKYTEDTEPLV